MTAELTTPGAWILTGMSGAGKASAAQALEAAGVDVVDNLETRSPPRVGGPAPPASGGGGGRRSPG